MAKSTPVKSKNSASDDSLSYSALLNELKREYNLFNFKPGKKFLFRPPKTIILGPDEPLASLLLLHELSHALLGHRSFITDIERIKMESDAWAKTRELADKYNIVPDEDFIETQLDTYRDWLHTRSKCKKCGLTRYQTRDGIYHCPFCDNV